MQSEQIKVWDPLVRFFHWGVAGGFLLAYVTSEEWLDAHVAIGYFILALLAVRIVWGFTGPQHARFSDFVRSPAAVIAYLKEIVAMHPRRYLGHNPAGGAMVVLLMGALLLTGLTGLAAYGAEEFSGPLAGLLSGLSDAAAEAVGEVHEFLAHFTLFLIGAHLVGVLVASLQHGENLPRAMVTGYKRR